jgi:hypothetical protein
VFLVNVPVGLVVVAAGLKLLPAGHTGAEHRRVDVGGAVAITGAMVLAVYAIASGNTAGWTSAHTLGALLAAVVMVAVFLGWEARATAPLIPLPIFRRRNLTVSSIVNVLWAAAMFALFFASTLYLQLVLGYSPLEVGLAFLPGNVVMMAFSLGLSAKLVTRYGFRAPLAFGLATASLALLWLARAPVHGSFVSDVLPAMILIGIGGGLVFNPLLTGPMSDVEPENSGLASGVTNTAFMMGGALGLAVLASAASARTRHLAATGHGALAALTGGYHVVFTAGCILGLSAGAIGTIFLRDGFASTGIHQAEAALEAT